MSSWPLAMQPLRYTHHLSRRIRSPVRHSNALSYYAVRLVSSSTTRPNTISSRNESNELTADSKGKEKEVPPPPDAVAAQMVKDDRLPFLNRPLGVKRKPSTVALTWTEEMLDQDIRMDHRYKLYVSGVNLKSFGVLNWTSALTPSLILNVRVKLATKGYYSDLNSLRFHGGKTWIAPRVLIREDVRLTVMTS